MSKRGVRLRGCSLGRGKGRGTARGRGRGGKKYLPLENCWHDGPEKIRGTCYRCSKIIWARNDTARRKAEQSKIHVEIEPDFPNEELQNHTKVFLETNKPEALSKEESLSDESSEISLEPSE